MQRKIIYFVNPILASIGKESLVKKIVERTHQQSIPFEILDTNPQGNYFYLKEKIDTENITDIVICGGDEMINQVAGTLMDTDINIGILPLGSGNSLALSAKISNQIDKALEIIFTGKAAYVDAFRINDSFSCMFCGFGFDARIVHDFAKEKKRGLLTCISLCFGNFIIARPYPFEIINRGKSFTTEAYFISISNTNRFGKCIHIAPEAKLNDGLLDIVVLKKMNKFRMLFALLNQNYRGKVRDYCEADFHKQHILYFQTDKLIIHNLAGTPLHVDGKPAFSGKKFMIEIIPDAFKLIQPR